MSENDSEQETLTKSMFVGKERAGESQYRERCLEQMAEECVNCGSEEDIVVHHIDGDRSNNDLENLIPLCRPCHTKTHNGDPGFQELYEQLQESAQGPWDPMDERDRYRVELIDVVEVRDNPNGGCFLTITEPLKIAGIEVGDTVGFQATAPDSVAAVVAPTDTEYLVTRSVRRHFQIAVPSQFRKFLDLSEGDGVEGNTLGRVAVFSARGAGMILLMAQPVTYVEPTQKLPESFGTEE